MNRLFSRILLAGLSVGISVGLATGANAQTPSTTTKVSKPFSVKLGSLVYTKSSTKDAIGDNPVFFGVGYDFLKTASDHPVIVQGFFDFYLPKERTVTTGSISTKTKLESMFGVGVTARYQLIKTTETSRSFPYVGLGLGFYSSKVKQTIEEPEFLDSSSKTKGGLGGKIFVGGNLRDGYIGEVEYNWLPSNGPVNLSGLAVRVGYKF
jgi:hypothetical protein